MTNKVVSHVESVLVVAGVGLGLAQIEQILGIVLLVFQVLLILFRVAVKIHSHMKKGEIKEALEEAKKGQDELKELTRKGENEDGKKD